MTSAALPLFSSSLDVWSLEVCEEKLFRSSVEWGAGKEMLLALKLFYSILFYSSWYSPAGESFFHLLFVFQYILLSCQHFMKQNILLFSLCSLSNLYLFLSITSSVTRLLSSSIIQQFTFCTSPLLLPLPNLVWDFIVLEIRFAAKRAARYRQ